MHAATSNDQQALPTPSTDLEGIFQDNQGRVFGTAYRVTGSAQDAEDVLQTVFLRLLRRQDDLDLSPSPSSYLYRAAVNASLDLLRSRARTSDLPLDELDLAGGDDPQQGHRDREIRRCLRQAILTLSPKAAEAFTLRFLQGFGNREIAEMTGSSQTAVGVALHRARSRARKVLTSCLGGSSHV